MNRSEKMSWTNVENVINERVPKCIKEVLSACGYTGPSSLKSISSNSITQIETHVNVHCRELIGNFTCSHAEFYKNQDTFGLLPGHRAFILAMAKTLTQHYEIEHENHMKQHDENELLTKAIENNSYFSVILKELVKTALKNGQRSKNNAEYSDIIRYFATYIFILSGRACYTVLCKNLPIPSIASIRKYRFRT